MTALPLSGHAGQPRPHRTLDVPHDPRLCQRSSLRGADNRPGVRRRLRLLECVRCPSNVVGLTFPKVLQFAQLRRDTMVGVPLDRPVFPALRLAFPDPLLQLRHGLLDPFDRVLDGLQLAPAPRRPVRRGVQVRDRTSLGLLSARQRNLVCEVSQFGFVQSPNSILDAPPTDRTRDRISDTTGLLDGHVPQVAEVVPEAVLLDNDAVVLLRGESFSHQLGGVRPDRGAVQLLGDGQQFRLLPRRCLTTGPCHHLLACDRRGSLTRQPARLTGSQRR